VLVLRCWCWRRWWWLCCCSNSPMTGPPQRKARGRAPPGPSKRPGHSLARHCALLVRLALHEPACPRPPSSRGPRTSSGRWARGQWLPFTWPFDRFNLSSYFYLQQMKHTSTLFCALVYTLARAASPMLPKFAGPQLCNCSESESQFWEIRQAKITTISQVHTQGCA
jgi:hypothetical protein